jgi:hypothetical protein
MKAEDIVKQLMTYLPPQTDLFTTSLSVTSITMSGNTATVNAVGHGLTVGSLFSIVGAQANATIGDMVREGEIGTARTSQDHNLTFDAVQIRYTGEPLKVNIDGATESEFNGEFELLGVPNRTHFQFKMPDAGATTATGSPVLIDGLPFGYNGTFNVASVIDDDSFTYELPVADLPDAAGTITLKKDYRISRIVNFQRAVEAYTQQNLSDYWLFVEIGDVAASKDRKTQSDATAVLGKTTDVRQQLIFPFTIYCFVNTTDDIGGARAKDAMNDVQLLLFRSLIGKQFENQLSCQNQNATVFVRHGTANYETANYVHAFDFEQVGDISFGDSVGYPFNVAFRDIELGFDLAFEIDEQ